MGEPTRRQFIAGLLAIAVVPSAVEGFNPFDDSDALHSAFTTPRPPVYTVNRTGVYQLTCSLTYTSPEIDATIELNGRPAAEFRGTNHTEDAAVVSGFALLNLSDGDLVEIRTSEAAQASFQIMLVA